MYQKTWAGPSHPSFGKNPKESISFWGERPKKRKRVWEREWKTAQPQRDFKAAEYQRRLNTNATDREYKFCFSEFFLDLLEVKIFRKTPSQHCLIKSFRLPSLLLSLLLLSAVVLFCTCEVLQFCTCAVLHLCSFAFVQFCSRTVLHLCSLGLKISENRVALLEQLFDQLEDHCITHWLCQRQYPSRQ